MTTMAALLQDVYGLTSRPDLETESKLAIKQTISILHSSGEYKPDIKEVVALASKVEGSDVFTISMKEEPFVRCKKPILVVNATTGQEYEEVDVSEVLDSNGFIRLGTYYIAGDNINIRTLAVETVKVAYLQKPDLTNEDALVSWIADEYDWAVVNGAAARVFGSVGKDSEAKSKQSIMNVGIQELTKNHSRV